MGEIKPGDYIKLKSRYSPDIEYALILDIYDLFDESKGIHYCVPCTQDQISKSMSQSWTPISIIEWYKHFESLDAIRKDMFESGFNPNIKNNNNHVNNR